MLEALPGPCSQGLKSAVRKDPWYRCRSRHGVPINGVRFCPRRKWGAAEVGRRTCSGLPFRERRLAGVRKDQLMKRGQGGEIGYEANARSQVGEVTWPNGAGVAEGDET